MLVKSNVTGNTFIIEDENVRQRAVGKGLITIIKNDNFYIPEEFEEKLKNENSGVKRITPKKRRRVTG